jgi:Brp/Blh family beta-carotene 15,15'-monooxygenase
MNNFSLNKYHTYIFFGLSVIFAFINFTLNLEYISIICFFLISTIGVSHGALDHEKGKKIIKLFKLKKIELFYLAYVSLSLIIILLWSIAPIITLIIFLIVASYHFGKEDSVFGEIKYNYFSNVLFFFKGSIVVLAPLYFSQEETFEIFKILNANINPISQDFLLTLILLSLLSNFLLKKNTLIHSIDTLSIIIINWAFSPLVAFTIYFCFLHSIRHSFSLIYEINKNNFKKGSNLFIKKALPLTMLTGLIFLISLYVLNNYFLLNSAILKVIFIGLASLTFPHILLEYLLEKNEKKS